MQAKHIRVTSYSHLASVELVTKRSGELLSDSPADRAVDRLLDLAGGAGHAQVVLKNVTVHLETELEVRSDLIAAGRKNKRGVRGTDTNAASTRPTFRAQGAKEMPQFAMHFEV